MGRRVRSVRPRTMGTFLQEELVRFSTVSHDEGLSLSLVSLCYQEDLLCYDKGLPCHNEDLSCHDEGLLCLTSFSHIIMRVSPIKMRVFLSSQWRSLVFSEIIIFESPERNTTFYLNVCLFLSCLYVI